MPALTWAGTPLSLASRSQSAQSRAFRAAPGGIASWSAMRSSPPSIARRCASIAAADGIPLRDRDRDHDGLGAGAAGDDEPAGDREALGLDRQEAHCGSTLTMRLNIPDHPVNHASTSPASRGYLHAREGTGNRTPWPRATSFANRS